MYTEFENLPKQAKVWIYQTNRQLTDNEADTIEKTLKPAINQWAAHGASLLASVKVLHNRFVVIGLDENQNMASGCSIDASTHWLKDLGEKMNIDFFDRQQAYLDGDEIKTFSVFQAKKTVENGIISPDAVVFMNNGVNNLSDIFSNWKTNAVNTYLKKYFSGQAV
jgi:hypothetical protein